MVASIWAGKPLMFWVWNSRSSQPVLLKFCTGPKLAQQMLQKRYKNQALVPIAIFYQRFQILENMPKI